MKRNLLHISGSPLIHTCWASSVAMICGSFLFGGCMGFLLYTQYLILYDPVQLEFFDSSIIGTSLSLSNPALFLFVLQLAITPTNIFMFTHGARITMDQPQARIIFLKLVSAIIYKLFKIFYPVQLFELGAGDESRNFSYFSNDIVCATL